MNEISFEIKIYSRKLLKLLVSNNGKTENLWFEFSESPKLNGDALATALSTLCGKSFESIRFHWPVSPVTSNAISEWTNARVFTDGSSLPPSKSLYLIDSSVLNFSGGLDSLASLACLGASTELVSLDFGGRFSRERQFFQKFETRTIRTNLIDTSLRRNSWSFMGLGALLYRNILHGKFVTFGSVLEAGNLQIRTPHKGSSTFPPFKIANFEAANSVAGVSEAGTIAIVAKFYPEKLTESLQSVASPGEEKYVRKIALADLVTSEFGLHFNPPHLSKPSKVHYSFGDNFAVDLTSLFFLSRNREEAASKLIGPVPPIVKNLAKELTFDFMLKADQNYYSCYPDILHPKLESTFKVAGLDWYSVEDYEEINLLRERLAPLASYTIN